MTRSRTSTTAQEWIAHDPDPKTAAELLECSDADLDERFAHPLTFGTAGLRGPLRGGPNGMNLAVVLRATWAVAKVLKDRGLHGRDVVVGRDARHRSDEFALAAAEVFAAQGFPVTLMFAAVPTPVVAFAVRHGGAVAGIQITGSHNPPSDNGYKVYFEGGFPIVPPTDRDIEQAMSAAPHADEIPRQAVVPSGVNEIQRYVERAALVRHSHGSVRVAVTPLHGVGGEYLMDALVRAGFTDVHVVDDQFAPDPDFPTVALPNPEEPGAVDAVLKVAADVGADIAVALDPDADRCAIAVPTPDGWRMLSGDETGWLLGDYLLSQVEPGPVMAATVVASSVVSSRMLAAIATEHGALPRRDTDRVQMAGARRRRPCRPARSSTPTKRRSATASTPRPSVTKTASAPRCSYAIWLLLSNIAATHCSTHSTTWPADTVCTPRQRCHDRYQTPTGRRR